MTCNTSTKKSNQRLTDNGKGFKAVFCTQVAATQTFGGNHCFNLSYLVLSFAVSMYVSNEKIKYYTSCNCQLLCLFKKEKKRKRI